MPPSSYQQPKEHHMTILLEAPDFLMDALAFDPLLLLVWGGTLTFTLCAAASHFMARLSTHH